MASGGQSAPRPVFSCSRSMSAWYTLALRADEGPTNPASWRLMMERIATIRGCVDFRPALTTVLGPRFSYPRGRSDHRCRCPVREQHDAGMAHSILASGAPAERQRARSIPRLLTALVALEGLGVLAIWVGSLRAGAFSEGWFAYQLQGTVPFFHLAAEVGMAIVALVGVVGWLAAARWSTPVLTFAVGMMAYGAVNSLGWALHNDVAMAAPMAITLATAVWLLVVLVHAGAHGGMAGTRET